MNHVRCEGWWEQAIYGRQPMRDLRLSIDGARFSGTGQDVIGPFTLTGLIERDLVRIVKQYIGLHNVEYFGTYDGEGTMNGEWRIGWDAGRWMIKIISLASEAGVVPAEIAEWKPA